MSAPVATRVCEVCGGDPRKGSTSKWDEWARAYRAAPCSHADGDRHQRHAMLTKRATEGYVLLAGQYGEGSWVRTLAAEVSQEYLRLAREAKRTVVTIEWARWSSIVPGAGVLTTWATVDGCEETAAQLEEWHRRTVNVCGSVATRQSEKAAQLRALVAAARAVERGVPWWVAIRAQSAWRSLPRWSTG